MNDGAGDYVESGWATVRTAWSDYGGACNTNGETNHPQAFYGWRIVGVVTRCVLDMSVSVNGGDNPTASVRDDSLSYEWVVNFSNGSQNGFTHVLSGMEFSHTGIPLTNCDRHWKGSSTTDPPGSQIESCDAHFTGMQYRTGAGNWADWGSEICWFGNTDPNYKNQLSQPAEVSVLDGQGSC